MDDYHESEKIQDVYNHGNQGNIMENLGNFVKLSPNQGTLYFCLLNIVQKLPNRPDQKRNQEQKEMKQN